MNGYVLIRIQIVIVLFVVFNGMVSAQHQWVKAFGGTGLTDYGNAVATDKNGNVYVTGSYSGSNINFGNGIIASSSVSVYGNTDLFVAKYNRSGICQWVRSIPGAYTYGGLYGGKGITADRYGNIIVCGQLDGSVRNWGNGIVTGRNSGGFVASFDDSGNTQWVQTMADTAGYGYSNLISPNAVTHDLAGNIYVTGTYKDNIRIGGYIVPGDPNNGNVFLVKYSPAGVVEWIKTNTIQNRPTIYGAIATSVYWSPDNQIYVSGVYGGLKLEFAPGYSAPKDSLNLHIFTARFDYRGNINLITNTTGSGSFYSAASVSSMGNPSDYSFYTTTYTSIGPGAVINFGNGFTVSYDPNYQGQYAFLVKKDYYGTTKWVKVMKTSFTTFLAKTVAVDVQGNAYVSGLFSGAQPVDFGGVSYTPQGADLVTARFTPAGNGNIIQSSPGNNYIQPIGLALDDSFKVVATGIFRGQQSFPPLGNVNATSYDIFIVKASTAGAVSNTGDSLIIRGEERNVIKNDTANIAVYLSPSSAVQAGSFEIKMRIDGTRMTVSGIDTAGTLAGKYKWAYQLRISGDTIKVALYGVATIVESGVFFKLNSYIRSTASGNIPLVIDTAIVNTGVTRAYTKNGLLRVNTGVRADREDKNNAGIHLLQSFPNPSSGRTTLAFTTSVSAEIHLTVHSLSGALVKVISSGFFTPGNYSFPLELKDLSSGTYYVVLRGKQTKEVKKLLLVK